MANALSIASGGLDTIVKPILYLVVVVAIIFLLRKGISAFQTRNVGTSGGSSDGSNLATDIYNLDSPWVSQNKIDETCNVALNLTDGELIKVYNKFKKLYGGKCPGGGMFCDNTDSMKIFLTEQSCPTTGCPVRNKLVDRLTGMGL